MWRNRNRDWDDERWDGEGYGPRGDSGRGGSAMDDMSYSLDRGRHRIGRGYGQRGGMFERGGIDAARSFDRMSGSADYGFARDRYERDDRPRDDYGRGGYGASDFDFNRYGFDRGRDPLGRHDFDRARHGFGGGDYDRDRYGAERNERPAGNWREHFGRDRAMPHRASSREERGRNEGFFGGSSHWRGDEFGERGAGFARNFGEDQGSRYRDEGFDDWRDGDEWSRRRNR